MLSDRNKEDYLATLSQKLSKILKVRFLFLVELGRKTIPIHFFKIRKSLENYPTCTALYRPANYKTIVTQI